ncbi:MAG: Rrf2 family transcriptional regulator [bacterium]|nr:MAG: Rrf2 family transcriptional regulator [bacterium]
MKVNTLQQYGLRAMIEIAIHEGEGGIFQKTIAKNQKLSYRYLEHIISHLKTAGLVKNKSGGKSGYVLRRPAEEITILEVLNAFQHNIELVDCIDTGPNCEKTETRVVGKFWGELSELIKDFLKSHTLKELADKQKEVNQNAQK